MVSNMEFTYRPSEATGRPRLPTSQTTQSWRIIGTSLGDNFVAKASYSTGGGP